MKPITILIASLILNYGVIDAQSIEKNVIASGGTILSSGNVKLEYTVGEVFTNTLASANNSITQGFHQPNILVARMDDPSQPHQGGGENAEVKENKHELETRITNSSVTNYSITVYPNPATDFVNVKSETEGEIDILLSDANGKIIRQLKSDTTETKIDFTNYSSGNYFLMVTNSESKKESFKIVKVN